MKLALAVAAAVLGAAAFETARRGAAFAPAGDSLAAALLGVAAGWALIAGASAPSVTTPGLLAAAGCAWLAAGLGWPGARWDAEFTLGLMAATAAPAFAGHAVLRLTGA